MGSAATKEVRPELSAKSASQGLAESKEACTAAGQGMPTITPRQIDVQPSQYQAGWSKETDATTPGKSRRASVDKSGRSIARNATLEVERGTPQDALQELLNGNIRFIQGESDHPHQDFARLQKIAPKQKPIAAILACADSRVPTEIVFDQGFGDVFVCRIAGNIATAEEIASLEYAVLELGVKVIMVMGHTSCGAVKAALSGKAFPGFIDALVDHLDVAIVRAQSRNAASYEQLTSTKQSRGHPDPKLIEQVIEENVLYQIDRCRRSTLILQAVKKGDLILVPSVYDLNTGEVRVIGK